MGVWDFFSGDKVVAHRHLVLRLSVYSYTFNSLYVFKLSCWIKHINKI